MRARIFNFRCRKKRYTFRYKRVPRGRGVSHSRPVREPARLIPLCMSARVPAVSRPHALRRPGRVSGGAVPGRLSQLPGLLPLRLSARYRTVRVACHPRVVTISASSGRRTSLACVLQVPGAAPAAACRTHARAPRAAPLPASRSPESTAAAVPQATAGTPITPSACRYPAAPDSDRILLLLDRNVVHASAMTSHFTDERRMRDGVVPVRMFGARCGCRCGLPVRMSGRLPPRRRRPLPVGARAGARAGRHRGGARVSGARSVPHGR